LKGINMLIKNRKFINLQEFNYQEKHNIEMSKELIQFYYDNFYNVNYLAFCQFVKKRNLHPLQLDYVPADGIRKKKWEDNPYDYFLVDYSEKQIDLAIDILKNGTYWPLIAHPIKKGKFKIKEGSHRIHSAYLAVRSDLWNLERFQCLILEDKESFIRYNNLAPNIAVVMNIPIQLKDTFLEFFSGRFDEKNIEQVSEKLLEVKLHHGIEIYCTYLLYPFWLKNILYKYNKMNPNDIIEPKFKLV